MTKNSFYGFFASFFITGSIVNDALILPNQPMYSWAKLFFIAGVLFLFFGKLKLRKLTILEIYLIIYSLLFIILTAVFSGGGIGERFTSISTSFIIGLISFFIITRTTVTLYQIKSCFCLWVIVSVILGSIQAATGSFYFTERIFLSTMVPFLYRASGFMSDPNYFSLICLIGLCLTLDDKSKLGFFVRILSILGVFLSGSRSGLLCLFILLILRKFKNIFKPSNMFLAALGILLLITTLYFLKDYLPPSIGMIFDISSYSDESERNSLSDRTAAIVAGYYSFINNPIFGYGIGNLTAHPLNHHGQMSHNTLIEILAENGLIGLILYGTINVMFFSRLKQAFICGISTHTFKNFTFLLIIFNLMSLTLVVHYSRIFFFIVAIMFLALKSIDKSTGQENVNHFI